jgi:indole-3-glycerol phosphate synthase
VGDVLDRIVASKRREIEQARAAVPEAALRRQAAERRDRRSFAAALAGDGVRVIAEIKRASPSRGPLAPDLDPARQARLYAEGGAAALSVLTDGPFFRGSPQDLQAARAAVSLPVLRKDFLLDPYQVYESAAMGADAILLIVRILGDGDLASLFALAGKLDLDALVEVHDESDAARAAALRPSLVAINNRDLASFRTDAGTAARLAGRFGAATRVVAASAIRSRADVDCARAAGIQCFLVGETLVCAADPVAALRRLRGAEASG